MAQTLTGAHVGQKLAELAELPSDKQPQLLIEVSHDGTYSGVKLAPEETMVFRNDILAAFTFPLWGGVRYFQWTTPSERVGLIEITKLQVLTE